MPVLKRQASAYLSNMKFNAANIRIKNGRKEEAVRALTLNEQFIENVDYQVLRKNAENSNGGRPTNEYKLTLSCMEFFIARKVRPVFEVYRQVFHKVAKHELSRKELALMVLQAEEEKERLLLENNHLSETVNLQTEELQKAAPKVNYYDTHLQSVNTLTSTQVAKQIGMVAEKLHKKLNEAGIIFYQSGQWLLYSPLFRMEATRHPHQYLHPFGRFHRDKLVHRLDGERKKVYYSFV